MGLRRRKKKKNQNLPEQIQLVICFAKVNNFFNRTNFMFTITNPDVTSIYLKYGMYSIKVNLVDANGIGITVRNAQLIPRTLGAIRLFLTEPSISKEVQFGASRLPHNLIEKKDSRTGEIVFFDKKSGKIYDKSKVFQAEATVIPRDAFIDISDVIANLETRRKKIEKQYKEIIDQNNKSHEIELRETIEPLKGVLLEIIVWLQVSAVLIVRSVL